MKSSRLQLHLQHDYTVDDQSTFAPRRLQAPRVHHLESTLRHNLVEVTQALRPAPRVSTPQKSVTISITLLCRCRQSHHRLLFQPTRVDPVRLHSPAQLNSFDCNDTLKAPKSSSANFSSHDTSIISRLDFPQCFKHPCCINQVTVTPVVCRSALEQNNQKNPFDQQCSMYWSTSNTTPDVYFSIAAKAMLPPMDSSLDDFSR